MIVFWSVVGVLIVIYYSYVIWVSTKYKTRNKKNDTNLDNLQINNIFVNNSDNKNTDLEAILDQVKDVENHSKLLEVFKKGKSEASYPLTLDKNEKLKIVRDEKSDPPEDSKT